LRGAIFGTPHFFVMSSIFIFMKSQSNKKQSKNIERLRTLCGQLTTRDDQLKRDLKMFEGFFSNFPIPVTMWSLGNDNAVLSKRGSAFACDEPKSLGEMFKSPTLCDEAVKKHQLALSGKMVTYFMEHENKLFWCKLVPRKDDDGNSLGVLGMAWDVTSNSVMLRCLETILELLDSDADPQDIRNEAISGLNASRLKKMLDEENLTDA